MKANFDLSGLRSIVTGAARGIGQGIAVTLENHGAKVLRADLNTIKRQKGCPKGCPTIKADIGLPADCDRIVNTALQELGGIDLLVNNAAAWSDKSFWDWAPEDWDRTFRVNVTGTAYLTRLAAGEMINRRTSGSIIFITSIHERVARRWHFDYSASKAAQRSLVQELALEFAPFNIRVNNIAPGHIENRPLKTLRGIRDKNPYVPLGGRSGLPTDIAYLVMVLASPASSYITGASITVDAGLSLHNHWTDQLPPGYTAKKERMKFLRQFKRA